MQFFAKPRVIDDGDDSDGGGGGDDDIMDVLVTGVVRYQTRASSNRLEQPYPS